MPNVEDGMHKRGTGGSVGSTFGSRLGFFFFFFFFNSTSALSSLSTPCCLLKVEEDDVVQSIAGFLTRRGETTKENMGGKAGSGNM